MTSVEPMPQSFLKKSCRGLDSRQRGKGILRVLRTPTSETRVRIQSRNGWFLMMTRKGTMKGTTNKIKAGSKYNVSLLDII